MGVISTSKCGCQLFANSLKLCFSTNNSLGLAYHAVLVERQAPQTLEDDADMKTDVELIVELAAGTSRLNICTITRINFLSKMGTVLYNSTVDFNILEFPV